MRTFVRTITGIAAFAASSSFLMPLSVHPTGVADCANSAYHFVMSDAGGGTVADTSNAKNEFCKSVAAEVGNQ